MNNLPIKEADHDRINLLKKLSAHFPLEQQLRARTNERHVHFDINVVSSHAPIFILS